MGHYAEALQSVERSLELDPSNPETYAIKTSITNHIAAVTVQRNSDKQQAYQGIKGGGPLSFFIGAGIQVVGLVLVLVGAVMPLLLSHIPIIAAFALQSLGFALLCVNAARGSYLYGFMRLLLTFILSVIPIALLGIGYLQLKPSFIRAHPSLMPGPLLFVSISFAMAGALPLLVALFAFILGLVRGVRKRNS